MIINILSFVFFCKLSNNQTCISSTVNKKMTFLINKIINYIIIYC